MEITARSLWTLVHGMGFGALYLLAGSGALMAFYHRLMAGREDVSASSNEGPLKMYLVLMSVFAWLAVLTGTYMVYPWYRATPPNGLVELSEYPQRLLMSRASTMGWHAMGMEWKEHVAWLVPITITMAAGVVFRYGSDLRHHVRLRRAVLGAMLFSLASAGIAGVWGAMINKYAPVNGGPTVVLMKGGAQ